MVSFVVDVLVDKIHFSRYNKRARKIIVLPTTISKYEEMADQARLHPKGGGGGGTPRKIKLEKSNSNLNWPIAQKNTTHSKQ